MAQTKPQLAFHLRIRPPDYPSQSKQSERPTNMPSIFEISPDSREIRLESNGDAYRFEFNHVFPQNSTQVEFFEIACRPLIENVLNGGNACLMAYGQISTGKSYSVIGGDNQETRGVIHRSIEYIISHAQQLQGMREFSFSVRFYDIYMNKVRDLGRVYNEKMIQRNWESPVAKDYMDDDLRIVERDGKSEVDGLCVIPVGSFDEAVQILTMGIEMRRDLDKIGQFSQKSHTIYSLTVQQRYTDHGIHKTVEGTINFIIFAGSDRNNKNGEVRIKMYEAAALGENFSVMERILLGLYQQSMGKESNFLPFKDTPISRVLAHYMRTRSYISFIGHVFPSSIYMEESFNTLNFIQRCKRLDYKAERPEKSSNFSELQVDRVNRLEHEVEDLKIQIEKTQTFHEQKLKSFAKLLWIDEDLVTILQSDPGTAKKKIANDFKEAATKYQNLLKRNKELEKRLDDNRKIFEEIKRVEKSNQDKYERELMEMRNEINDLKDGQDEFKETVDSELQNEIMIRVKDLHNQLVQSHMELEERSAVIYNLQYTMQNRASELRNAADLREMGKGEIEHEYLRTFRETEFTQQQMLEKLNDQYENYIKKLNQELVNFHLEAKKKDREQEQHKFREHLQAVRKEAADFYAFLLNQRRVIENISQGAYNYGIKPVLIPTSDIPNMPAKHIYPKQLLSSLFRGLTNRNQLGERFTPKTLRYTQQNTLRNTRSQRSLPVTTPRLTRSIQSFRQLQRGKEDTMMTTKDTIELPDYEISQLLSANIKQLKPHEVRLMGAFLQQKLAHCKETLEQTRVTSSNTFKQREAMETELARLQIERDKGKDLYTKQVHMKFSNNQTSFQNTARASTAHIKSPPYPDRLWTRGSSFRRLGA